LPNHRQSAAAKNAAVGAGGRTAKVPSMSNIIIFNGRELNGLLVLPNVITRNTIFYCPMVSSE
jgi:hypothetical protein